MQKELINSAGMARIMDRLAFEVLERCPDLDNLCLIGIQRRGVVIAKRIHSLIKGHTGRDVNLGVLDITLYRDDLSEIASFPQVYATDVNFSVDGKTLILIDDVLFTGRTVRAALEAISDLGRTARIYLMALIDRGHRELPIHADFVGKSIPTARKEIIHVRVGELDSQDNVVLEVNS